ncbi:MAG: SGNH/GDSL hydrolase family protein [Clostridia bacterium]|nr:SGNH/GDSL hydrolase family protein [Clostridia bacterium]
MELQGKKINFLGDSITEGCGVSCEENIYHQIMKRHYGLAEARNYGVGGTRFARQLTPSEPQYDRNFLVRAAEMDKDADVIVVMGGTNDFGHGDAPLGTFFDRENNTFYGACHQLFTYLLETYPEAVIAVCTPLHRSNEDDPMGDHYYKTHNAGVLKTYVNIIREVAEYYSLPVIDLFANSGIQPKVDIMKEKYMPDGLHPNDAGHEKMAQIIGNFLLAY